MIVVADTSVILNLCLVGQEHLLQHLFGEILCPTLVCAEFKRLTESDPRFPGLVFPDFIKVIPAKGIQPELLLNHKIHAGEIEAISLALNANAQALLIDERAGRKAASAQGLRCIGILGILLQAKFLGFIEAISPLISELMARGRFRIAPGLVEKILEAAGEN